MGVKGINVKISLSVLSIFFSFNLSALGTANRYPTLPLSFEQISLQHGLSQSMVFCILQDKRGFMWFGTQDGLNKYDGYRFTVYKTIPFDNKSLSFNEVKCLYEDSRGDLWVGTSRGLNRFIASENTFEKYFDIISSAESSMEAMIEAITEDEYGNIVVGTFDGIRVLSPTSRSRNSGYVSKKYTCSKNDPGSLTSNIILNLFKDKFNNIWVVTDKGLNKLVDKSLNPHSIDYSFLNYKNSRDKIYSITGEHTGKMASPACDSKGNFWISTGDELLIVDPQKDEVIKPIFTSANKDNFKIKGIWKIHCSDEEVWAYSYYEGLIKIKLSKKYEVEFIERFKNNTPQASFNQQVKSIYENKSQKDNLIWIGTSGMGIYKVYKQGNFFTKYNKEDGLPDNFVSSVVKDDHGMLWVGTNNGLARLNRKTGDIKTYFKSNSSHSENGRVCVYRDKSKNIWVGTKHGINIFDTVKNDFKHIDIGSPGKLDDLWGDGSNICTTLYEDSKNNVWIATKGGIKRLDKNKNFFKFYKNDINNAHSILDGHIYAINEDKHGNIWIGTASGLCKYNPDTDSFSRFSYDQNDKKTIPSSIILCLTLTKSGDLWMGTPQGFSKLEYNNGKLKVESYSDKDELVNNFVYGILEDDRGNLWMSTNGGVSKFNPKNKTFRNYKEKDGLQSLEFNSGAFYKASDGEMFFGGILGLNSFNPNNEPINKHQPPVFISGIHLFGKPLSSDSILNSNRPIELNYNQNFLLFEFAALDYKHPEFNQYAYKMEGLNDRWINLRTGRIASFNNLPPGEYVLKVKASNDDGIWNHQGREVKIIIKPPFYRTLWFFLLVVIGLFVSIALIHNYLVKRKIKRFMMIAKIRHEEHEKVRKKTAEDFHDELGNRLTRISVLAELAKSKFHNTNEDISLIISKISDNASTLFYGTKDLIWSINPENDSFNELAIRLKDFGDELFDNTNINFKASGIALEFKEKTLPMDAGRHLVLIFKEAMTNALKHSKCKNILLLFSLENDELYIELSDDGNGFANNKNCDGNGLLNMQSRAKKINAKLSIDVKPGRGTTVKLHFSITQNILLSDNN